MIEAVYFFLFASVAVGMVYMPAHLRALGFSGAQISSALAIAPLLSLAVPLGWAWLADRTRRHDRVLQGIAFGAWLGFAPLAWAHGRAAQSFALLLAGYAGYAAFFVGMGTLTDALAVVRVRAGAVYGRIRLWGSVGHVTAALSVGALLGPSFPSLRGALVPCALWAALGGVFLVSLWLRGSGEKAARPRLADVRALLAGQPALRLLLVAGALHWACMAPYNVFFGVFLHDLGLPPLDWGFAFAIGVTAEMLVLLAFHRIHARVRLDTLLAAAFLTSALRWLGNATLKAPAALIALQALHGMTFGMFWSAGIALVAATVPPELRATGQALLVMAINVGGAIGNLAVGRVYDRAGSSVLFAIAAVGEILPLAVILYGRRRGVAHFARATRPA
ncbi:MAG TPA: MFS transporter [Polyangia bacterium]|nr:MFS transporter [Polyangia bacterium]